MKNKGLFKKGKNVSFSLLEVILIVFITGIFVSIGSGVIIYKNLNNTTDKKNTIADKGLKEFEEVYNNILNSYVEDVDKDKLIESAINAMFNYIGDNYSNYLDPTTTSDLQDRLNGEYYGLGVVIYNTKDGYVEISNIFEDSPADKFGLKIGDRIISIDEESMIGKTSTYVSSIIKNSSKETISLVYQRSGVENSIEVKLEKVNIQSITSNIYNNIGYLKINTFSAKTYSQFKTKLSELEGKNIKSLIIDVRDNAGGYLETADDIADLFIKDGKTIYQLKKKDAIAKTYKANDGISKEYNVVVLMNENSASASEILALALKESYNAVLVGKKSFGKGTVQEVENLSSGAMVKYTTAYWLSPNGNSINEIGINPDYDVNNSVDKDEQLDKAIELLK